jgi:prepilin-type processing-associated H-X9-DG protein
VEMLIFSIIIFLVIKLIFFTLLTKKKALWCLKDFAIANLSALTASVLIWFFIHWLHHITWFRFSASRWSILAAFVTLIIIESIFYCKFEKEREKSEMILLAIVINLIAVILSSPFLLSTTHKPDKYMFRISCTSNLKLIGLSLKQYAMDYDDWFPDKSGPLGFEKLRSTGYLTDYGVYRCPSCKGPRGEGNQKLNNKIVDYVYRSGLKDNDGSDQSKTPLAWDRPTNHENYGNVLFLDGHVKGFHGANWMEQAGIKKTAPR